VKLSNPRSPKTDRSRDVPNQSFVIPNVIVDMRMRLNNENQRSSAIQTFVDGARQVASARAHDSDNNL
jgi:hypothetical protein